MDADTPEIVEAVARKFAEVEYGDGHDEPWEPFIAHAREVVPFILEEAAKVLSTVEPDEDAAGCPATWGDFVQVGQSAIRSLSGEGLDDDRG